MTQEKNTSELQTHEKQEVASQRGSAGAVFRPDIDVLERPDEYVIFADMPGIDEHSVDIRLERGKLTLDAELATLPEAGWTPIHTEYRFGAYHREFRISQKIDDERVSARVHAGVLELHLPKSAETRPRAIPVQAA